MVLKTGQKGWTLTWYVTGKTCCIFLEEKTNPSKNISSDKTKYIVDHFRVSFREKPGNDYRLIKFIPTGLKLKVLSNNNGWTNVVDLESGQKGWVLSRYLVDTKPCCAIIEEMNKLEK